MNGPEDFEAVPPLSHLPLEETTPEACCQRKLQSREGMFVNRKACLEGDERFQNRQVRAARWLEKRLPSRDGCGSHGLPTHEGAGCAILTVAEFVTTLTLLTTFEVVDM